MGEGRGGGGGIYVVLYIYVKLKSIKLPVMVGQTFQLKRKIKYANYKRCCPWFDSKYTKDFHFPQSK